MLSQPSLIGVGLEEKEYRPLPNLNPRFLDRRYRIELRIIDVMEKDICLADV